MTKCTPSVSPGGGSVRETACHVQPGDRWGGRGHRAAVGLPGPPAQHPSLQPPGLNGSSNTASGVIHPEILVNKCALLATDVLARGAMFLINNSQIPVCLVEP